MPNVLQAIDKIKGSYQNLGIFLGQVYNRAKSKDENSKMKKSFIDLLTPEIKKLHSIVKTNKQNKNMSVAEKNEYVRAYNKLVEFKKYLTKRTGTTISLDIVDDWVSKLGQSQIEDEEAVPETFGEKLPDLENDMDFYEESYNQIWGKL